MNINELIEQLTESRNEHGNIEVRLSLNPDYPTQHEIKSTCTALAGVEELDHDTKDPDYDENIGGKATGPTVFFIQELRPHEERYTPWVAQKALGVSTPELN